VDDGFHRRIGLFTATMLVAGNMVGSGIFIVSSDMSRDVGGGGWLLVLWLLTGLMTVLGGLCYAELAGAFPKAGGQYLFLKEAFSPLWGFLYGWSAFTVIQCGSIAAVAVAFTKFLGVLWPVLGAGAEATLLKVPMEVSIPLQLPWMPEPVTIFERHFYTISTGQLIATGVIVLLTFINCLGVASGALVQNVFTVAKLLALSLVIVMGLGVAIDWSVVRQNLDGAWVPAIETTRVSRTMMLTDLGPHMAFALVAGAAMVGSLFSADAWANVTLTAGEVKNPGRNMPLSLVLGTCMVIALYILCNLAYMAVLPVTGNEALAANLREQAEREPGRTAAIYRGHARELGISQAQDDRVGTAVMDAASPGWGRIAMACGIMVSTFGCVNGMILVTARLYWAMARDGLFFRVAGTLNSRGVPQASLIMQAVWSIVLVFSGTYSELLDYVIFASLLFYAITVAGLVVLRIRRPDLDRPYRVPGYPVVPILYFILCLLMMSTLLVVRPEYTWPGLILVGLGVPVYFGWKLIRGRAIGPTGATGS
jgi:APA family basic amino acid/polyamine antiporter